MIDFNKIAPWNWFKKEDEMKKGASLPVRRVRRTEYPLHPAEDMRREFDRLFDEMLRGFGATPWPSSLLPALDWPENTWLKPNVDISLAEENYTITVELPGVSEEDVHVEVAGDTLRIHGEKKQESEEKDKDHYAVERSYGAFQRMLSLPEDAEPDGIDAKFKNGVMTIVIPRKAAAPTDVKQIDVKAA